MTATAPAGAAPAPGRAQSTAVASVLALIGAVVTTAANFGIAIAVSTEGSVVAGLFFTATAVATIAGNAGTLGTHTALVYFLPGLGREGSPDHRGVVGRALAPVLALSVAVTVLGVLAAGPIADALVDERVEALTSMLRIVALTVPAWAVTTSLLGASRGLGTMTPTAVVSQIGRPAGQLLLIVGLVAVGDATPVGLAVAWAIPVFVTFALTVVWVGLLGGYRSGSVGVTNRELWSYSTPRALSTAMQIALERIDVVLVSAILGLGAAGVYGSVTRYVAAGNFLIFSVAQATSPNLRGAISHERWAEASVLLRRATAWLVLVAGTYFVLVAAKAEPLARLINDEYDVGATALAIAALGMLASAIAGPVDLGLLMSGRSGLSLLAVAAAIVTDLVGVVVLAPRYDLAGVALAWAASVAVQNGLATVLLHRVNGLVGPGRPTAVAFVGAVLATLPAWFLPDTFVGLVVSGLIAGAVLLGWTLLNRRTLGLDQILRRG